MKEKLNQLTLEEKISLVCGGSFWETNPVERLDIPTIMLSDGPHGLRKQEGESDHLGLNESIKTVCFPAASATASSFDKELLNHLGHTLGTMAKQEEIDVLLGPAMNIKRSPLCGRNFEYFSEDPYLTGELASAYVKGVQAHHVATSPKHFAVNNQEHRRMSSSSNLDERTLREIYLPAFEKVVKEAKPLTMMAAYNQINGTFACDNDDLLNHILRDEWGFDGMVVSDWGAATNRASNLKAGLDLSMPASPALEKQLRAGLENGQVTEEALDVACLRILDLIEKVSPSDTTESLNLDQAHDLARRYASDSIVLLKNNGVLPLTSTDKLAFVGEFARHPRIQGGGSSHINAYKTVGALSAVSVKGQVAFAQGYTLTDETSSETLIQEAVSLVEQRETVVVFAGLPDSYESEGYDRKHMQLPPQQNALIEALVATPAKVIVVLHNGSPVEMPWLDKVDGLLEVYLSGEAVGEATIDVLFGDINPSGRLPETLPYKLSDTPTALTYGKTKDVVNYDEGIFVGYRYYTAKEMPVAFPFGFGLSYTQFAYSDLTVDKTSLTDKEDLTVTVTVTNVGQRAGKEVVQLYVAPQEANLPRAVRELKAFEKIELATGESKVVSFQLDSSAMAYWNECLSDWYVASGNYTIQICRHADEVILSESVEVETTQTIKQVFTIDSVMGDIFENPRSGKVLSEMMGDEYDQVEGNDTVSDEMLEAMMANMPLRALMNFTPELDEEALEGMVYMLNQSQE
ncbi:TPA: glycoside hydrolase family 3 C-terminal domain-containing protein [Streptococcus suis]